jgi:hypothetical protein
MKTLRTTLNLRRHDVRRLLRRGYEIEYIETRHLDNRDETVGRTISPKASFRSEVVRSAGSAIEADPVHAISCPGAHQQYRLCAATISVLMLRTLRSNVLHRDSSPP